MPIHFPTMRPTDYELAPIHSPPLVHVKDCGLGLIAPGAGPIPTGSVGTCPRVFCSSGRVGFAGSRSAAGLAECMKVFAVVAAAAVAACIPYWRTHRPLAGRAMKPAAQADP